METNIWFITREGPPHDDDSPGWNLVCLAWDKQSALRFLRDVELGQDLFDAIEWQLSADAPDYHYGAGYWDDKWHYYVLCTEEVLGIPPSNNGVQPTAELAGSESIAADSTVERQPAAADA